MNIFRSFFLIFFCVFPLSVFSDMGGNKLNERGTVLELCFNELLMRRHHLQRELKCVVQDLRVAKQDGGYLFDLFTNQWKFLGRYEDRKRRVTSSSDDSCLQKEGNTMGGYNYDDYIFSIILEFSTLFFIEDKHIDLAEKTCDQFITKACSDLETKIEVINAFFMSAVSDTEEMIKYKLMTNLENTLEENLQEGEDLDGSIKLQVLPYD